MPETLSESQRQGLVLALIQLLIGPLFWYGLRARRTKQLRHLCCKWMLTVFFGFSVALVLSAFQRTKCGAWVSLLAYVVLFIGVVGEAATLQECGFKQAIWRLLTCRIRTFDPNDPRCLNCEYSLLNLTSDRCPECGRPLPVAAKLPTANIDAL